MLIPLQQNVLARWWTALLGSQRGKKRCTVSTFKVEVKPQCHFVNCKDSMLLMEVSAYKNVATVYSRWINGSFWSTSSSSALLLVLSSHSGLCHQLQGGFLWNCVLTFTYPQATLYYLCLSPYFSSSTIIRSKMLICPVLINTRTNDILMIN